MGATLLLLSAALTSQPKGNVSTWVTANSMDGAFSFAMPAKPTEKTVVQESGNGPIDVLEYSCTVDDCLYRVEKGKLPMEIPDKKLEGALDATRDSMAQKFKILDDQARRVAGWPARELLVEAPLRPGAEPSRIAMLILYTDQEFYQVRIFALRPGTPPKDVRKFFDSFRPKKSRPGTKGK
jgi:hypothetical protein